MTEQSSLLPMVYVHSEGEIDNLIFKVVDFDCNISHFNPPTSRKKNSVFKANTVKPSLHATCELDLTE